MYESSLRWLIEKDIDSQRIDYHEFRYLMYNIKEMTSLKHFYFRMVFQNKKYMCWFVFPSWISDRACESDFYRIREEMDKQFGTKNIEFKVKVGIEFIK